MKVTPRHACVLLALVASLLETGAANGFHETTSFTRGANTGGGAGSYYTGSPRFKGYDCALCHTNAEERISIELSGALSSGTYEPGLIYRINVKLRGEHRGLGSAFNPNTFAMDVVDDAGDPVGTFSAGPGSIVRVLDDRRVAVAEGFGEGEVEWDLSWVAPLEPLPARLYIAMLDGDGASDPENRFIDPLNDDIATLRLDLCPAGMSCPEPPAPEAETSPAGCAASSPPLAAGLLLLLFLPFVVAQRRRRKPL